MMKKIIFFLLLSIGMGCKPVGGDSQLQSTNPIKAVKAIIDRKKDSKDLKQDTIIIPDTNVDKAPAPVEDDGVLWKLSGFWKVEEGKVKNLAPKMFVDSTSIFFSTKSDPRTTDTINDKMEDKQDKDWDAITPEVAKKAGALKVDTPAEKKSLRTTLSNLRKKEKLRVATNLEVGTDNLQITGSYWIDVYVLKKRMFSKSARTFEISAKAGIASDSETKMMKPSASITGTAFGMVIASKEVTTAKGFKYAAPIPPIVDAAVPVYGLPALEIVVTLGVIARAELLFNLTARKIGSATLTMSPTVGLDATVGPGVTVGPATASIEAKLLIFEAAWPVSATVGGSKSTGVFWGGVTYDGQDLKALQGAVLIKLSVAPPLILKPFFFAAEILLTLFTDVKVEKTSWSWEHEIWAAKNPWWLKKGEGYAGPSFRKILKKDAATCKKVVAKINEHIADVKGPAPTADKNYTEVKSSIEKMLVAIKNKKCP